MNHLTAIRKAFHKLHTAYEVAQCEGRKDEALKLVADAQALSATAIKDLATAIKEGK